jgi:hypothetical protein
MSSTDIRQHVHSLVDQLPRTQLAAIERLLSAMIDPVSYSLAHAPADDEALTEEEQGAIRRSEAWFNQHGGKGIPTEEVLAEFGLSMKNFPLEKNGG